MARLKYKAELPSPQRVKFLVLVGDVKGEVFEYEWFAEYELTARSGEHVVDLGDVPKGKYVAVVACKDFDPATGRYYGLYDAKLFKV